MLGYVKHPSAKDNMTKYKLEFFDKGSRKPYKVEEGVLTNGHHPRFTDAKECFDYRLTHIPGRVKVRYASNGGLAAETYIDANGHGRLRWFKD